jgi:hypothetical protein
VDSVAVPYIKEAAVIFTFYATGVLVFAYLAAFHITETEYFNGEEDVVIPKHVLEEHASEGHGTENGRTNVDKEKIMSQKEAEPSV